jgi:hypothetical protein
LAEHGELLLRLDYSRKHLLPTRRMKELTMKLHLKENMKAVGPVVLKMRFLIQKFLIEIEY